jgi:hypothetical protein
MIRIPADDALGRLKLVENPAVMPEVRVDLENTKLLGRLSWRVKER